MNARLATLLLVVGACSSASSTSSKSSESGPRSFTMFVTTEMRGTIEPCGCTTDPLGDLARTTELVLSARRGKKDVLVVDGGSMLYTEPRVPEHLEAQERLKAALLVETYTDELKAAAIGLGPYDLAMGPGAVKPPRQVANLAPESGIAVAAPKVVEAGGVRVGIFGVVAPAALSAYDVGASDPVPAAREAIAGLRKQGARLVVGLAHMTRKEAADLARAAPGIDILVVGQNAPAPDKVPAAARKIGTTYLVEPADRGQVVSRLDITVRDDDGPLADAIGEARAAVEIGEAEAKIAALKKSLAEWQADPSADPGFIEAKKKELAAHEATRSRLQASPVQAPEKGSWFVMSQIAIKKGLACNQDVQAAKTAFDQAAGQANVAAAKGTKPPAPDEGQAGYAGVEECSYCHAEAVTFWQGTRHHQAWETLEEMGKQFNYDCISCHVTGWDRPGGANLAHNEHLRDVQCETCHGPGSLHVEADGQDSPRTVRLTPPQTLCEQCHSPEHSDTFDYEAYLRDVTGPGHGEAFRKKLGDGPTGRELRKAGLEKAGAAIGAGCIK